MTAPQRSEQPLGLTPLAVAERAPMQKLFVMGHLLPGVDLSPPNILYLVEQLGKATNMNIFQGPTIKTPQDFDPETFRRLGNRPPEDINVTWMWDDSGGGFYVFPDRDYWCVIDLHTCKVFDPRPVLELLYRQLHFREDIQFAQQTHETSTPWQSFVSEIASFSPEAPYLNTLSELLEVDKREVSALIKAGGSLEEIVYRAIKEGWGSRLAAVFNPELTNKIRNLHSAFEIATDYLFMEAVLSGKVKDVNQYPFQNIYHRLARMEAEAAAMTQSNKSVIHIGTGWPGTAIGLYQQFGIPVTCVEINPEVAQQSRAALEKLGLYGKNKIQVVNADGSNLNPSGFGTVIISAMVPKENKLTILNNLRDLAVDGIGEPLLVLRQPPDHARALFYQPLPDEILFKAGLNRLAQTTPGEDDPIQSLVSEVLPRAEARRGYDRGIMAAQQRLITV